MEGGAERGPAIGGQAMREAKPVLMGTRTKQKRNPRVILNLAVVPERCQRARK